MDSLCMGVGRRACAWGTSLVTWCTLKQTCILCSLVRADCGWLPGGGDAEWPLSASTVQIRQPPAFARVVMLPKEEAVADGSVGLVPPAHTLLFPACLRWLICAAFTMFGPNFFLKSQSRAELCVNLLIRWTPNPHPTHKNETKREGRKREDVLLCLLPDNLNIFTSGMCWAQLGADCKDREQMLLTQQLFSLYRILHNWNVWCNLCMYLSTLFC